MNAINIQQLKRDDLITFYSAEEQKWLVAQITDIGLNYVHLHALEGNITGFRWTENLRNIKDPEHYRMCIPKPPKRKSRFIKFLKKLRWI